MPQQDCFIQEFEACVLVNEVRGENVLSRLGSAWRCHMIVVRGEPELRSSEQAWTHKKSEIKSFAIVFIDHVLHRAAIFADAPSIAHLRDVMQSISAGERPGGADAHVMNRQDAAIIFKFKQEGPAQRGLHQRAVVIGSVVVSDSGVIAPRSEERRVGKECRSRWAQKY